MYILTAKLIDEEAIKSITSLNGEVEISRIVPFIMLAQDLIIQPILGTALYTRMMEGVLNQNLNPDEETLLKIINPCLAYYTIQKAIYPMAYQIRSTGIVKSENSEITAASVTEVERLSQLYLSGGEWYAQRLKDWLCANSRLYPQYNTETAPLKPNRSNSFRGGIYYEDDSCDKGCGCNGHP